MKHSYFSIRTSLLSLAVAAVAPVMANTQSSDAIEEVLVTASLRQTSQMDFPASVSIFNQQALKQQSISHLEQVLNQSPNVNFSSGASRGRYIQIRGIGERGEFIEPVNHSVGVLLDGIDFTGISSAITTLDVQQIEVLRGPQGTVYGANSLAGLINVRSNPVSDTYSGSIKGQFGEYNTRNVSGVVNLPFSSEVGLRIAAQNNTSDGYTENAFLNRDDTSEIDETNVRATLAITPTEDLSVNVIGFYANTDNGYDGFSLDNERTTLSDQPGRDAQETVALSTVANYRFTNDMELVASLSHAQSDIEYSYDEDWVYVGFCDGLDCDSELWGFDWEYSSFDRYLRDNDNTSLDLRLLSAPGEVEWLIGAYYRQQDVDLKRIYTFADDFQSAYETENTAIYGELTVALSDATEITVGLRGEQRQADYLDNTNVRLDNDESAWGGKWAINHRVTDDFSLYGTVSRGYKFGGFNPNDAIEEEFRSFDAEYLTNYELGIKTSWLDGRGFGQIALFYQDRDDVQIANTNVQCVEPEGFPCTFDDYQDNASGGKTQGIEAQFNLQVSSAVSLYGSLGYMDSEFTDYVSYSHVDADLDSGQGVDLDGHELPQAPSYTFVLGTEIAFTQALVLDLSINGKDDYYFSNDHEFTSDAYELVNARLSYSLSNWQLELWGRNLTDEDYAVRGFGSFSNDPREFYAEPELYIQYGEPRVLGITVEYSFQ